DNRIRADQQVRQQGLRLLDETVALRISAAAGTARLLALPGCRRKRWRWLDAEPLADRSNARRLSIRRCLNGLTTHDAESRSQSEQHRRHGLPETTCDLSHRRHSFPFSLSVNPMAGASPAWQRANPASAI